MTILPAVDIREGRSVRLLRGERAAETVYGEDPVETALHWQEQGAEWLHVVDLDAAFGETGKNQNIIDSILTAVEIPVQVGGGIRKLDDFRRLIDRGACRVVFGTAAVENPSLVESALAVAGERVVVGVDVREGKVAVRGWADVSDVAPVAFGRRWKSAGVGAFVYTDVLRDGSLEGPNSRAVRDFALAVGCEVVASGGIGRLDDLRLLMEGEADGVAAVIVGRALYEKAFTLKEAMAILSTA